MADDLDSTERKIRTALKLLTKMEIVTIETTKHYSIITLRNWAKYQDQETNDQQVTNTRPTLDQHPTIEEEGKKVKKVKNINLATPDGFEEWWNVYPRRQKRMDAENAWRDLNPDQELQSQPSHAGFPVCVPDGRRALQVSAQGRRRPREDVESRVE